jgi:hypothetical protein
VESMSITAAERAYIVSEGLYFFRLTDQQKPKEIGMGKLFFHLDLSWVTI